MIRALRLAVAGLVALTLAGCGAEYTWAEDDFVTRSAYSAGGPVTVTLITGINTRDNTGAHTGLLIDGAQRLLFDPAGNWHNPGVPERNDVFFGMSPPYMDLYFAFHAAGVFVVHTQSIQVSAEVAQQLSQAVQANGPANPAFCSRTISTILSNTPGFEQISTTWFPVNLMEQFAALPGVTTGFIEGTLTDQEDLSHEAALAQFGG